MMMPLGRSVWATATIPPIATKRMTNAAAIVWPSPSEILPSVATLRMYPPARNWYETIVVKATIRARAPNRRANFP